MQIMHGMSAGIFHWKVYEPGAKLTNAGDVPIAGSESHNVIPASDESSDQSRAKSYQVPRGVNCQDNFAVQSD
jgi:hypothetical protein